MTDHTGGAYGGAGIHGSVTMHGGTLTANGGFGQKGINGNVIFYGGSLNAQGGDNIDNVMYGIAGNATLSWTNATDRFYANSIKGTVTVASGKAFTSNGTDLYSGQLASGSINGKTLQPATAIVLADNADNSVLITAANDLTLDVTLQGRTLYKDGAWNTLCLPFAVSTTSGPLAGDNVQAMTLDAANSGLSSTTLTLNFTSATSIPAGTPFIIKWDNTGVHLTDANLVFTGVTIYSNASTEVTFTGGKFVGTYKPIEWETENKSIQFLGTENTLYWPQPKNGQNPRINAFRAYFHLSDGNAGVREFKLNFGDEEAQGISDAPRLNDKGEMINDKEAGAWYSLDGRKLDGKPTRKGLYINNGVKAVIK